MSTTGKTVLWIVIAVIVVGGGIWWWVASQSSAAAPTAETTPPAANQGAPTTPGAGVTPSSSYPSGDSDQSIQQDMASVNAQMNGLGSDNASVTQSLNDQPVQQAQ